VLTATVFEAGGIGQEPAAVTMQQFGVLSRTPGRVLAARSVAEIRDLLAGVLQGLYADSRVELYVTRGDDLLPVTPAGPGGAGTARRLLEMVRCRAAIERRPLTAPQLFAPLGDAQAHPMMTAPLLDREELVGVVVVEAEREQREFRALDLVLLEGLAAQASLALHRLHAKERDHLHARLRTDLESARRIQRRLMRNSLPAEVGVTAHVEYLPAEGVGGDFYSITHSDDGRVAAAIGDVSGKGVSAALVMSRVSADIQRALASGSDPAFVLRGINAALDEIDAETFVTAACLQIDTATRTLTVASAGHLPLLVRRATGEVFTCGGASGTPLGMLPSEYEDEDVALEPSDIVLLMTDGLVETLHSLDCRLGMVRLLEIVREAPHDPALLSERIGAAVERSRHGVTTRDDVTWVALQLAP
jgi:serine phosphatase RsbU (regulator of sigma subunit)